MNPKVAIVGSGPSGCYAAQALVKRCPEAEITVIDALPVPYGLVRYGVAPDHQGTKAVQRQFARLFERQGVIFIGNCPVGPGGVALHDLQALFDTVVLATGLAQDRGLGPAFDGLQGVYGAGAVTRFWNGYLHAPEPTLGKRVIIVGNGNVALDVARLLSKGPGEFDGSDIAGTCLGTGVEEIDLVGRSAASAGKFDPAMMRELGDVAGLRVALGQESDLGDATDDPRVQAVQETIQDGEGKRLTLHFGLSVNAPVAQEGRVTGVTFTRADGPDVTLPCNSVITAIGFDDDGVLGRAALLAAAEDIETGRLAPGLYVTGWFRRGPTGTIPVNRTDAQTVAAAIAEDLADQGKPGAAGLRAIAPPPLTDFQDWQAIDTLEQSRAGVGRCRAKLTTRQEMLAIAAERRATA